MVIPRDSTFIWPTLVRGYLVGTSNCLWSAWFQANHKEYKKADSTFDLASWQIDHANLIDKVEKEFRQKYQTVYREYQNTFTYKGKSGAQFKGTPDLVGIDDTEVVLCDVKTGQKRDEDWAQVLLYLYYYSRCFPETCGDRIIRGELRYRDGYKQEVYIDEFTQGTKERVTHLLQTFASPTAPPRTPSCFECGNCKIHKDDCEDRIDNPPESNQLEMGDF